ncbi:30S ribosomal protein S27ae [archaeon]|nr:30S ribosomal protein S27ae [archaeon]
MGNKGNRKNHAPSKKYEKYKIEGGKVKKGRFCPRCGPGVFLGNHEDRVVCGKCGYVEVK